MIRLVALISGRGSNLQAVIDAIGDGRLNAELAAVIGNRPDAAGLERAHRAGIPTRIINHRDYSNRDQFDTALSRTIDRFDPDLVVLAGFMRVLGTTFVAHYQSRLVNIHPSLLPAHRGLGTHARALAAGEREHGASVHFVTPELDGGPVIARARVEILPDDDPDRLAARVLTQEHRLYPAVIGCFAAGRIRLEDDHVLFDDLPLTHPLDIDRLESLCDSP